MDFTWIAINHSVTAVITLIFILGLIARQLNLPPLIGFLIAGFIIKAMGVESFSGLDSLADLGITLLLFTIGLKLDLRGLMRPEIWAVSSLHIMFVVISFGTIISLLSYTGIPLLTEINPQTALLLAFAMSFSSTVFAVKILEEKGELKARHGRIAISILIMQDIFAVLFLTIASGKLPSPWAIAVVIALILCRPLFAQILKRVGHGELLVVAGFVLAMGGATLFELVDMKADLGALVMGMILARQKNASEMATSLLAFKDFFLIGFFISIGLTASVNLEVIGIALILLILMPLKVILFYWLLTLFKLRARTSFLTSLGLANYSEFGLIVSSVGYNYGWISSEWLGVLAVALAFTFILASPLNISSHTLYARFEKFIVQFQRRDRLSSEQLISTGDAEILVFGMGRVGTATYETMQKIYGNVVMGVDNDPVIIEKHIEEKRRVIHGDGTDIEFWEQLPIDKVRLILLDMPKTQENLFVYNQLEANGYGGKVAATARYDDEVEMLKEAGIDAAYNIYGEAGAGFANHVSEQLNESISFSKSSM